VGRGKFADVPRPEAAAKIVSFAATKNVSPTRAKNTSSADAKIRKNSEEHFSFF
jgi:hypothetical protein